MRTCHRNTARYFPPNAHGEIAGWTDTPVEEWAGPGGDEELLRAALASGKNNVAASFGDGVTFADIWNAAADKLAKKWPSDSGAGYDASQADAALAAHLAYWTGKDCERIRGLMQRSALARPKWENRPAWLETTIIKACAVVRNVAKGNPAPPAQLLADAGSDAAVAIGLGGVVFDGDAPPAPPRELIKGLLPAEGIAFLGGQSGAGKTFVVVALSVALAGPTGGEFFGLPIKERVGVVIVAAEGMATLGNRLEAAKANLGIAEKLPIAYLALDGDLTNEATVAALCQRLAKVADRFRADFAVRLGVVAVDTIAAAFAMEDENSNAEASRSIRVLRKIGAATEALVIPVHHYGKGREAGLRGASGFRAGADGVLSVLADRDEATGAVRNRSLSLAKSRVGEEGPISGFDLVPVWLGRDDDGNDYESCAIVPNLTASSRSHEKREARSTKTFRDAFAAALITGGIDQPQITGRLDGRATPLKAVRDEFLNRHPTTSTDEKKRADAARNAFNHARARLGAEFATVTDSHGVEWIWSAK